MKSYYPLIEEIHALKQEKNAVILVHNYQRPEIYEVADFIGDSLELSKKARETEADTIVFAGVHFMAETAKILNPEKTVLLPSLQAGCSLADFATAEKLKAVKAQYPDAAVVSYVNTTAEVKALSDACCTSMNAVKVVNALPQKRVIFLPDKHLGSYVASQTDKEIILWDGYCYVHNDLKPDVLQQARQQHPGAKIIAHPECNEGIRSMADHICGTGGMATYAKENAAQEFIVVTECGMREKLQQDVPDKKFFSFCKVCFYMKFITLENIRDALVNNKHIIEIPEEIRIKAEQALIRMFELTNTPLEKPLLAVVR